MTGTNRQTISGVVLFLGLLVVLSIFCGAAVAADGGSGNDVTNAYVKGSTASYEMFNTNAFSTDIFNGTASNVNTSSTVYGAILTHSVIQTEIEGPKVTFIIPSSLVDYIGAAVTESSLGAKAGYSLIIMPDDRISAETYFIDNGIEARTWDHYYRGLGPSTAKFSIGMNKFAPSVDVCKVDNIYVTDVANIVSETTVSTGSGNSDNAIKGNWIYSNETDPELADPGIQPTRVDSTVVANTSLSAKSYLLAEKVNYDKGEKKYTVSILRGTFLQDVDVDGLKLNISINTESEGVITGPISDIRYSIDGGIGKLSFKILREHNPIMFTISNGASSPFSISMPVGTLGHSHNTRDFDNNLLYVISTPGFTHQLKTGNYVLYNNVKLTEPLTVNGDVRLCLNGYTLTAADGKNAFDIIKAGELTIEDCTEDKTGKIIGTINVSGGTFTLCSGKIEAAESTAAVTVSSGTAIIEGGKITGNVIGGNTVNITGGTFKATGGSIIGVTGYPAVDIISGNFNVSKNPIIEGGYGVNLTNDRKINLDEKLVSGTSIFVNVSGTAAENHEFTAGWNTFMSGANPKYYFKTTTSGLLAQVIETGADAGEVAFMKGIDLEAHEHGALKFDQNLSAAYNSLGSDKLGQGNYVLLENLTIAAPIPIADNAIVNICFNGHHINVTSTGSTDITKKNAAEAFNTSSIGSGTFKAYDCTEESGNDHTHGTLVYESLLNDVKDIGEKDITLPEGNYTLKEDLQLGGLVTIESGMVRLCLNGYNITASAGNGIFNISGGNLSLTDCKAHAGKLIGNGTGTGITVNSGSTLIMTGGHITNFIDTSGNYGVNLADGAHMEINGRPIIESPLRTAAEKQIKVVGELEYGAKITMSVTDGAAAGVLFATNWNPAYGTAGTYFKVVDPTFATKLVAWADTNGEIKFIEPQGIALVAGTTTNLTGKRIGYESVADKDILVQYSTLPLGARVGIIGQTTVIEIPQTCTGTFTLFVNGVTVPMNILGWNINTTGYTVNESFIWDAPFGYDNINKSVLNLSFNFSSAAKYVPMPEITFGNTRFTVNASNVNITNTATGAPLNKGTDYTIEGSEIILDSSAAAPDYTYTYEGHKLGDIDGDGKVTLHDTSLITIALNDEYEISDEEIVYANVECSAKRQAVTLKNLVTMNKWLAAQPITP